jgi:hypothetical protein
MIKVSKEKFFRVIGPLNVHPSIRPTPYPYTSDWKDPHGTVYGKSTDRGDGGTVETDYYLAPEWVKP